MNARCTICSERSPYARPISNVILVTINGIDVLVCRKHTPKSVVIEDESKS